MGVRGETLHRVKRSFPGGVGNSLLAIVSTRRPSQDSISANAELVQWTGIRPWPAPWSTRTRCHRSRCIAGSQQSFGL